MAKRTRLKIREGDIFSIPLEDGRKAYGIVYLCPSDAQYIGIIHPDITLENFKSDPDPSKTMLCGWTTDALLYHDIWHIIDNIGDSDFEFPTPYYKVNSGGKKWLVDMTSQLICEIDNGVFEKLHYAYNSAPMSFQDAVCDYSKNNVVQDRHKKLFTEYVYKMQYYGEKILQGDLREN